MKLDREKLTELFTLKLAGATNEVENRFIDRILKENEEAQEVWEQLQQKFNQPHVKEHFENSDTKAVLQKIINNRPRQHMRKFWLAAASIAIVCTTTFLLLYLNRTPKSKGDSILLSLSGKNYDLSHDLANNNTSIINSGGAQVTTNQDSLVLTEINKTNNLEWGNISVPLKKDFILKFSDGSTAHLNSLTNLKFPIQFVGNSRDIHLDGEAYFTVSPDALRPFIVHTSKGSIEVLGTSFNVNAYNNYFKTSLVEGKVKISTENKTVTLLPGEEASLTEGHLTVSPFNQETSIGWRTGSYYFTNATLEEVVNILARNTGYTAIIADSLKKQPMLRIRFNKDSDPKKILESLKKITPFNFTIQDSSIRIY